VVSATLYEILELSPKASQADIKHTYRQMVLPPHPDRPPGNAVEAERRFRENAHAYCVLSEPSKRSAYDAWLMANRAPREGAVHRDTETNAFDTFLAKMVCLAFKLANRGADQASIYRLLVTDGCPEPTAQTIARRAHELGYRHGNVSAAS
jgi:DnaJ-class molecular chaperone